MFQSTHPRGVRLLEFVYIYKNIYLCFNPRTREGCDSCAFAKPVEQGL